MRTAAPLRLRSIRQVLLPLMGFTDWHEGVDAAGRPVWKRYIAGADSWEFRPMTPEEEAEAFWWCHPPLNPSSAFSWLRREIPRSAPCRRPPFLPPRPFACFAAPSGAMQRDYDRHVRLPLMALAIRATALGLRDSPLPGDWCAGCRLALERPVAARASARFCKSA